MIGAAQPAAAAHKFRVTRTVRDLHEVRHARGLHHTHGFWSFKVQVYQFYHSKPVQYGVAGLILANFVVECIQRQVDPHAEKHKHVWNAFEDFFCAAFLIELIINMYGSWMKPFFRISWNYFDMFVVAIGILILVRCPMPGSLRLVLMLRSFRVFRLFGRVESLKKIIHSITLSLPGMLNAFVIMLLVVCIYAVLAVDLYSQYYTMVNPDPNNPEITARGDKYSEEYYGNFLKSLFTLFQILTGESWSEMGVRPILSASPDLPSNIGSALFFTTFVLINSVVLLNVVVAVLLDGMAAASDEAEGSDLIELDSHLEEYHKGDLNAEEGGEATKEDENPDLGSDDCDDDEEAIQKDMAVLTQQVDSMSVQLKEVLTGLRMLEEQQRSKDPAIKL